MNKITTLFAMGFEDGQYGVATQKEINQICKVSETTVTNQTLASYDDVEWSVSCGCNLSDGMYSCKEGILMASEEGIELISNLRIAV